MKVLTLFGTRPEIIRLSLVIKRLDKACDHVLVHTGQNFNENLSDIFFDELEIRKPDLNLGVRGDSFGAQVGELIAKAETVFDDVRPDRVLLLGDTNSALVSIVAARRGIPVYHMEAGNRCYDDRVPEEVNRRIIDHSSTVLLPYTQRSKENLVREGIERERIFVTGNPIYEVLCEFKNKIDSSDALERNGVKKDDYLLATIHRAENVDDENILRGIFESFESIAVEFGRPVLVSVHPRTANKLTKFGLSPNSDRIRLLDAMPFFTFIKLEKNAAMVLTDSGTVQEECSIFRIPNVTVRNVTERPETVECGSNIIGGTCSETIMQAVKVASTRKGQWLAPEGYEKANVSETVCNIVLGYTSVRRHPDSSISK
jgi:UDP-N-acetylglucosamine 2-epimerase (non-hydrolysing)